MEDKTTGGREGKGEGIRAGGKGGEEEGEQTTIKVYSLPVEDSVVLLLEHNGKDPSFGEMFRRVT